MRHIKIKILTILLLSTIWSFGQLTQAYKNGFVAATSNGVYYLIDGDNQWINLGGKYSDTIKTISFYKDNLVTSSFDRLSMMTYVYGLYGLYQFENYLWYNDIGNKSYISNKLKYNYGYFNIYTTNSGYSALYMDNDKDGYYVATNGFLFNCTSIATDNDSTIIAAGINNKMLKIKLFSNIYSYCDIEYGQCADSSYVSGLASSSYSGHQITYNPTDDLFYIVSDEGYVYTYDKTTVTKIKEIASYCDGGCDSVTDVAYSLQDSILYIGVVNSIGEKRSTLLYLNNANNGTVNQINYTSTADIQMTINSVGKVLFNINNGFYLYGKTSSKILPSIPSGTTIYDLDYIDYLPYVDKNKPVITVLGDNPDTILIGETYVDDGYLAMDFEDGNITANVTTSNNINNLVDGTYTVTYNVTDSKGNQAIEQTRTVIVDRRLIMEFNMGAETLTIPFYNTTGYNCTINWGDGSPLSIITTYDDLDRIHTYVNSGIYNVKIDGTCKGIYFNNSGSKDKLTKIKSWGNVGLDITWYSFYGCSNLTTIPVFNSSMTYIKNDAFNGCTSLTSVIIPNTITYIGIYAFNNCSSLSSIVLPNSITSIESHLFSGCSNLSSVTLPNNVTSIGTFAFFNCSSLLSITLPSSLKTISSYAFNGCSHLTSIVIPNSVTSLGSQSFQYCSLLSSVTLPNSITEISGSTFHTCSSLTSIDIPSSVTIIRSAAFQSCTSLTSVTVPSTVTSIGLSAFAFCNNSSLIYTMNPITPPTLTSTNTFQNISANALIKVPSGSVNTYKTAQYWSPYADRIVSQ